MKVKIQDIFMGCIAILIVMNLGILNIADVATVYRYITSVVAIILAAVCICDSRIYQRIEGCCHYVNLWFIFLFLFLFAEVLYGWAVGQNSLLYNLSMVYIYFWLLLFYPIMYILLSANCKRKLIYTICGCTLAAVFLKTLVWFLYNYLHKDMMHYLLYEFGGVWLRNGFQRIPATCFSGILVCTMVCLFFNVKSIKIKVFSLVVVGFNFIYALLIFASRAQLICFVLAISVAILFRKNIPMRKVLTYLVFAFAVVVATSSAYFDEFIQSMSLTTYSMGTRVREVVYYLDLLKNHWVMGFLYSLPSQTIQGRTGEFYLSDLGMFSKLFEVGILGMFLHLIPFWRMFQNCRQYLKKDNPEYLFGITLLVYTVCFSFLSNDIYSFRLLFGFPFILTYFEYLRFQYKIQEKDG